MTMRYWFHYLISPIIFIALVLAAIDFFDIDLKLATFIYHLQGDQWALKSHWLLENILHTGARQALLILTIALLALWLASFKYSAPYIESSALGYLLLTAILSVLVVALLKKITQVDCPWYIQNFGGDLSYYSAYQSRPSSYPSVSCFPAGHASSGYAWLGIFYLLKRYAPSYRYYGLAFVLIVGLILGLTQQLRGAHFLSHDLWTLGICWFIASLFSPLMTRQKKA